MNPSTMQQYKRNSNSIPQGSFPVLRRKEVNYV